MRTPALAIAWELWARHRRVSAAAVAAVIGVPVLHIILWACRASLPDWLIVIVSDREAVVFGLVLYAYFYLLFVSVYGDLVPGGRPAGFPPRLFTMPVRTYQLVGWPMLFGTSAAMLLWLWVGVLADPGFVRGLAEEGLGAGRYVYRPGALLPGLAMAAHLAWTQALSWTIVRSPLLRLAAAILGIPSVVVGVVLLGASFLPESTTKVTAAEVDGVLCAAIGSAYALAVAGVARERRGDRQDWARIRRMIAQTLPRRSRSDRPFASAEAAQFWLEARRHAGVLPLIMTLFLVMLFWAVALPVGPEDVVRFAAAVVGVPVALAFFVGFAMGKNSFWAPELGLSSFTATRPMTASALAGAKFRAAGLSALLTWGVVLVLAPLLAVLTNNVELVRALGRTLFPGLDGWELGLLVPVALAGLVGLTWLQLVAGMGLSLTGRAGVVNGAVLLYGAVGSALAGLGLWTYHHPGFLDTLVTVLWCLGCSLGLLKLGVAAWVWRRLGSEHDRMLPQLAVLWMAVAVCLVVVIEAMTPAGPIPVSLLALFVILSLPLTRLIALPAAVAWNRHR